MSSPSYLPKVKPIYHNRLHASIGDVVTHANLLHQSGKSTDQLYLVVDLVEECTGVGTDMRGEEMKHMSWMAELLYSGGKTYINVCYLCKVNL